MTDAERHKVLVEWNQTAREYPLHKCLHQLFEEQVERTPDAVALVFEGQTLTYRELDARANQLAHHLITLGAGFEARIALYLERSIEMVVAIIGTLKSGAAYVPIDPAYPKDRVSFMVEDASPLAILTQDSLAPQLTSTPAPMLRLDTGWSEVARHPNQKPPSPVTSDNLAYVIYTSGSTGRPKGVMNNHRGVVNRLLWGQENYQLGADDAVMQKTPFGFDVSIWEFFWPLMAGARLIVAKPNGHRDSAYLVELINRERITIVHFVPSMLRVFLQDPASAECTSLRRVFSSGEALSFDLQESFFRTLPRVSLHDLYGPTEAAIEVTYWDCRPKSGLNFVPIGRPIANTQIYILDENLHPVPAGATGELFIGGIQVARGYHNRPELTAERFIRDPFRANPSARLYRSGDLARILPDGNIEYLGRLDDQVKIRGVRVELGEIESVLAMHPSVKGCAVVARENGDGEKTLTGLIVPQETNHVGVESLRSWIRGKLPEHMVPTHFELLDALPVTPNGKLDRKELGQRRGVLITGKTDETLPRNLLEQELVNIYRRLFGQERIGSRSNFFDLGGHSLLAARLMAEVERLVGAKLPIAALLQLPTPELLASRLAEENWAPPWASLVPLQSLGSKPPIYFIHGWKGEVYVFLELAQLLAPDQPVYGLQAVGLDGKVPRDSTVEQMGARYANEIRSFQSHGPYLLGGYSSGGLIAYETAKQLSANGRNQVRVILLDTEPRPPMPWGLYLRALQNYLKARWRDYLHEMSQLRVMDYPGYARKRAVGFIRNLGRNRISVREHEGNGGVNLQPAEDLKPVDYYESVTSVYRLKPFPGSVHVLVTADSNAHLMPLWWGLARGGASFQCVPGTHGSLLESQNLPAIGEGFKKALAWAENERQLRPAQAAAPSSNYLLFTK